jgi:very-short-patch-repair endonuclease
MFRDAAPKAETGSVAKARKLRREMSLPEVLLWRVLRARPQGIKFRRQHASGPYILDFYCSDARLAVEIDGHAHEHGKPAL